MSYQFLKKKLSLCQLEKKLFSLEKENIFLLCYIMCEIYIKNKQIIFIYDLLKLYFI